jgi:Double zinc ribbon
MAELSSTAIILVVVIVVLAVVVVGLLFFVIRRLRQRRDKLLGELRDRPELVQDRAFNRIAMARREAEILARQGTDVARARDLIAQAQGLFDTRNYDRAYQTAQQAHETLVHARKAAPLARESNPGVPAGPASPPPMAATVPSRPPPSAPAPGIPKNRAESQFQLRLLDQDLAGAPTNRSKSASRVEATRLRADAGAAFDRGDFTEAFRLALKGRRALGSPVEALPVTPRSGGPAPSAAPSSAVSDAALTAEQVAGADRCPECGYPALAGDTFCRGCGVPRTAATCAACGAPRKPADTFCGRCGARFS